MKSKRLLPRTGKDIVRHLRKLKRHLTSVITKSEDKIAAILSLDYNKIREFSQNMDGLIYFGHRSVGIHYM